MLQIKENIWRFQAVLEEDAEDFVDEVLLSYRRSLPLMGDGGLPGIFDIEEDVTQFMEAYTSVVLFDDKHRFLHLETHDEKMIMQEGIDYFFGYVINDIEVVCDHYKLFLDMDATFINPPVKEVW